METEKLKQYVAGTIHHLLITGDDPERLNRLKVLYPEQYHLAQGEPYAIPKKSKPKKSK